MKTAVSISLGSSKRDKTVEIELMGQPIRIERRGSDGDIAQAKAWFAELDGKVDAFGVGGIDLWVFIEEKQYAITSGHKLIQHVTQTPVVDGSGLKNTLERQVVSQIITHLGEQYSQGNVLLTIGTDRFGMTRSFVEHGAYEITYGDLMFTVELPIPIRSYTSFKRVAGLLAPIITKLPISLIAPTGSAQEKITPKFQKWYEWADIIAGDCHYIRRFMPDTLHNKLIVTNTTTPHDLDLFRQRGVQYVMTTTPQLDGRSFGTNMMEAALTAVAAHHRPLTNQELNQLITQLDLKPTLHTLT